MEKTEEEFTFNAGKTTKITSLPFIIKTVRKKHKLSLEQLSMLCGMKDGAGHLSEIENGKIMPDLNTLENIFNQLHLKIEVVYDKRYKEEQVN